MPYIDENGRKRDGSLDPMRRMFYVAMRFDTKRGASASCIADDPEVVAEFKEEYRDREIRLVDGDEMKRLMTIDL